MIRSVSYYRNASRPPDEAKPAVRERKSGNDQERADDDVYPPRCVVRVARHRADPEQDCNSPQKDHHTADDLHGQDFGLRRFSPSNMTTPACPSVLSLEPNAGPAGLESHVTSNVTARPQPDPRRVDAVGSKDGLDRRKGQPAQPLPRSGERSHNPSVPGSNPGGPTRKPCTPRRHGRRVAVATDQIKRSRIRTSVS